MKARFRRPQVEGTGHWRHGEVIEPLPDQQVVAVIDSTTGGTYVVEREYVQVQVRGPRGGLKWLPL
jgi:hypothetical protein